MFRKKMKLQSHSRRKFRRHYTKTLERIKLDVRCPGIYQPCSKKKLDDHNTSTNTLSPGTNYESV